MTRKEMIETIAKQAGCSKRLVRKQLFARSAELKRRYRDIKFNEAFLNPSTNWLDKDELRKAWSNGNREIRPWGTPFVFDVCLFPSGCVVMFEVERVYPDGYRTTDTIGARLYSW